MISLPFDLQFWPKCFVHLCTLANKVMMPNMQGKDGLRLGTMPSPPPVHLHI